jgi:hypothetical protein
VSTTDPSVEEETVPSVDRGAAARSGRRLALALEYRLALVRELEVTRPRRDGITVVEDLDDAWRVGVADPAVSALVVEAWRRTNDPPASWPGHAHRRRTAAGA